MFKSVLLAGAAAILAVGAASAADLPRRAEAPVFVPVPVFTWTGFYFGVNAGYAYSESDTVRTTGINNLNSGAPNAANLQGNVDNRLRPAALKLPQEGFSAGAQIGYNYQLTPGNGIVIGIEADAQYTDLETSRVNVATRTALPSTLTNTYRSDLQYLGTVRGRVGYAFDKVMVYGTGGFAYGGIEQSVSFQTGAPVTYAGARSTMETGYAYGGGIEYALPTDSFLNFFRSSAVTLKAEYLRYDLGSRNLLVASTGGPGIGYNAVFKTEGAIARAGLNYKFGSY
ncbi:porin family protein [Methylobacterium sp. W2]|uniref:outer membrane protein n=1 Tax=Methylobacterium sp. W2 TaxID=2598107 RepID=UPI001D0C314B|nr:porin family protein [Methylobacterium sp. W2]MCC0807967.1 porin family protein [Methylobacterium sp. W2]